MQVVVSIAYTAADNPLEFEQKLIRSWEIITKGFDARGLKRPMHPSWAWSLLCRNAESHEYIPSKSSKYIKDIRDYITVDGGMTDNIRSSLYAAKYDAIIANKAAEMPTDHLITVAEKEPWIWGYFN